MDNIFGVELVFGPDQNFVCMPDEIRCKADIPASRQRALFIGRHGADAFLDLPAEPPEPTKRDDGLVLARADLKSAMDKARWIGTHGEDAWLAMPATRPE